MSRSVALLGEIIKKVIVLYEVLTIARAIVIVSFELRYHGVMILQIKLPLLIKGIKQTDSYNNGYHGKLDSIW